MAAYKVEFAHGFRQCTSQLLYHISIVQTPLIKAAQKTNHIHSALIYMQLKFHVNPDKPDRRRAEERGMRERGGGGRKRERGRGVLWDTERRLRNR